MPSVSELIRRLDRRADILSHLIDEPSSLCALDERVPESKPTLSRALRLLSEYGIVEYVDGEWTVTRYGNALHRHYCDSRSGFESIMRAKPLIDELRAGYSPPDTLFTECESYLPEPQSPHKPISVLSDRLRGARCLDAYIPVRLTPYFEAIEAMNTGETVACRVYFDPRLTPIPDGLRETAEVTVQSPDNSNPYSLFVVDDTSLWLGVHDSRGSFRGFARTEDPESVSWARDMLNDASTGGVQA